MVRQHKLATDSRWGEMGDGGCQGGASQSTLRPQAARCKVRRRVRGNETTGPRRERGRRARAESGEGTRRAGVREVRGMNNEATSQRQRGAKSVLVEPSQPEGIR